MLSVHKKNCRTYKKKNVTQYATELIQRPFGGAAAFSSIVLNITSPICSPSWDKVLSTQLLAAHIIPHGGYKLREKKKKKRLGLLTILYTHTPTSSIPSEI